MAQDVNSKTEKEIYFEDKVTLIDSSWIKSAFMVNRFDVVNANRINLYFSKADGKYTDSSIGGGIAINPKPQYTRYADPRRKGRGAGREDVSTSNINSNIGMGRYYSDAHDDTAQLLTMTFGVPEFQSMFSFFSRAIDYPSSVKVNQGRTPYLYYGAKFISTTAVFISFPLLSVAIYLGGFMKELVLGASDTRYYTMKPDMMSYWDTVNSLVTYMAVERGIVIPMLMPPKDDTKIGIPVTIDSESLDELRKLAPNIITNNNYINVYAIATKAHRKILNVFKSETEALLKKNTMSKEEFNATVNSEVSDPVVDSNMFENDQKTIMKLDSYHDVPTEEQDTAEVAASSTDPKNINMQGEDGRIDKLPSENDRSYLKDMVEYFETTVKSGGSHAIFRVEYLGSTTDSFSNSLKDIPAKEVLNGLGTRARDIRFSLSGGNVLGDAIDSVRQAATDVITGTLDGLTFGLSNVLIGLLGGGYMEMPQMWADSSANLAKHDYKIVLTSPYGNPISQLMNIDIPLAMILAGALPRQIGKSAYSSPMLCSAFLRGYQDMDLGMITDVSITRGVTNLSHTETGRVLSLEVSFTVTDFSSIVAAPVTSGIFGSFNLSLDDTKPINKFLNTLAGRSFYSSTYLKPRAMMRISRAAMDLQGYTPSARIGLMGAESIIGRVGMAFVKDINLINLEGQNK